LKKKGKKKKGGGKKKKGERYKIDLLGGGKKVIKKVVRGHIRPTVKGVGRERRCGKLRSEGAGIEGADTFSKRK